MGCGLELLSNPAEYAMAGAGPKPAAETAQVKVPGRKVEGGDAWIGETCSNLGPG